MSISSTTVTTDDLLPLLPNRVRNRPTQRSDPGARAKAHRTCGGSTGTRAGEKGQPPSLYAPDRVLAGGGIGYYFKIYKPKHEAPDLEDDYCEYEDGELEEIAEEPEDEDTPPWEEDTEE